MMLRGWWLLLLAGCGDAATLAPDGGGDLMQLHHDFASGSSDLAVTPPDALMTGPPVGSPCTTASACGGAGATCLTSVASATPTGSASTIAGGYCSRTPCATDGDCDPGGFCDRRTGVGACLAACNGKGQCAQLNAATRCFLLDGVHFECLPLAADACDPTSSAACGGSGACYRSGFDDVGSCLTTCTYGGTCSPDAGNKQRRCFFANLRVDGGGSPTGDAFAGLVCLLVSASNLGVDQPCRFFNDCTDGYECDIAASKTCKKLCRQGMSDCSTGAACANAFALSPFQSGNIGLCR